MNKKSVFILSGLMLGSAIFAAPSEFSGWCPTQGDVKTKNPEVVKLAEKSMTLKGIKGREWIMFKAGGIKSEKGTTISITFTAAGKGKVFAGYYGYRQGFSLSKAEDTPLLLTDKPTAFKLEFPLVSSVKIVRPRFRISPDAEITVSNHKVEIK